MMNNSWRQSKLTHNTCVLAHTVAYAVPVSLIEHIVPASTVQKQVIIQECSVIQDGQRFGPQEQSLETVSAAPIVSQIQE